MKCVLVIALLSSLLAPRVVAGPTDFLSGDPPGRAVRIDQNLGRPIPGDLVFRDESGRLVRLGDYFGKSL